MAKGSLTCLILASFFSPDILKDMRRFFFRDKRGQATVEYILIFGLMALIAVGLVKSISAVIGKSVGGLGTALSNHLSIGVCKRFCFYDGFRNKIRP